MIYYAHPINLYGSVVEAEDIDRIERHFGHVVLSPHHPEFEIGYMREKRRSGRGMHFFFEQVLPLCDACVFRAFPDGMIGAGVKDEILWFWESLKLLPVYEITNFEIKPWAPNPFAGNRWLSVSETVQRVKQ